MYYLQSRYYNPELGRFVSADVYAATGQGLIGNNTFAYCGNNPINYSDSTGNLPWHIIIPALIAGGVNILAAVIRGDSIDEIIQAGVTGAAVGAIIAKFPNAALIFTTIEMTISFFQYLYEGYSLEETFVMLGLMAVESKVPSTNDKLTDTMVDATFSLGYELCAEAGIVSVERNSNQKGYPHNFSSAATGGIIGGGYVGYVIMWERYSVEGDLKWI